MAKADQARKVVTPSPTRKVGMVNCRWAQDFPVEHESQLEKRFIHSSLLLLGLEAIQAQPFTLELEIGKYTPDFLLHSAELKLVVEVKWSNKVKAYHQVFNQATRRLAEKGYLFYVVTQEDVDYGQRGEVASEILRYAKAELSPAETQGVIDCLSAGETIALADLQARAQATRETILHLVARRCLTIHPNDLPDGTARIGPAVKDTLKAEFETRFRVKPWNPDTPERAIDKPPKVRMPRRPQVATGPYLRAQHASPIRGTLSPLSAMAGGLPIVRLKRPDDDPCADHAAS